MNLNVRDKNLSRYFVRLALFASVLLTMLVAAGTVSHSSEPIEAQSTGICDRTPEVQTAIMVRLGISRCEAVTDAHLAVIPSLFIELGQAETLRSGDLAGLTRLFALWIDADEVTTIEPGAFNHGMDFLSTLILYADALTTLPSGTFEGLGSLEYLIFDSDSVTSIDDDVFDPFRSATPASRLIYLGVFVDSLPQLGANTVSNIPTLQRLSITGDSLSAIDAGAFAGLTMLEQLRLRSDSLNSLPDNLFQSLSQLTLLDLHGGSVLSSVSPAVFTGLSSLEALHLDGSNITSLTSGNFAALSALTTFFIDVEGLSTIPSGAFSGLNALTEIHIHGGSLENIQSVFSGLPSLQIIHLLDNNLQQLPSRFFANLPNLREVHLDSNGIRSLSDDAFGGSPNVREIYLHSNMLTTLPDGVFDGLSSLRVLDLHDNALEQLPLEVYQAPIICTLEEIDIGSDVISSIPSRTIDGTQRTILQALADREACTSNAGGLTRLALHDIPLTSNDISAIKRLNRLSSLNIANSQLSSAQIIDLLSSRNLASLTSINLSRNDLSGFNTTRQREWLGSFLQGLDNLEALYLNGVEIDGETALVVLQNINVDILNLSLANNDLTSWNLEENSTNLASAVTRLNDYWSYINLENTGIDSRAAAIIIPKLRRLEAFTDWIRSYRGNFDVTLNLSNNWISDFDPQWFAEWEVLEVLDLSCNQLTKAEVTWFAPLILYIEELYLHGNPFTTVPSDEEFLDIFVYLDDITTSSGPACQRSDYSKLEPPSAIVKVSRIEFGIRDIHIGSGEEVRLSVDLYGRQNVLDNDLADLVVIHWSDNQAGGMFNGSGHRVTYTTPDTPGTYTITAHIDTSQCSGDADECQAELEMKVRTLPPYTGPILPVEPYLDGDVPKIMTGDDGTAYEVFTPMGDGQYIGDGFSIVASPGSVQNGEYIGVAMEEGESAANVGQVHQRYTTFGSWYTINAVDSTGASITDYQLGTPVEVCIPFPEQLRANINDVAIVAMNASDGSLTVLSSHVQLRTDDDPQLCGKLSRLPAQVAAGKRGAPDAAPTPIPLDADEDSTLPETGGAPIPIWALILAAIFGASILTIGTGRLRLTRNR